MKIKNSYCNVKLRAGDVHPRLSYKTKGKTMDKFNLILTIILKLLIIFYLVAILYNIHEYRKAEVEKWKYLQQLSRNI